MGELRCLSCAQETELHPHLSLLSSLAAGWAGSALCSGSPRSISKSGENCAVQENCPTPGPVLSTAERAVSPCASCLQGYRCLVVVMGSVRGPGKVCHRSVFQYGWVAVCGKGISNSKLRKIYSFVVLLI